MNNAEKTRWNRKFRQGLHQSLTPDPFLVRSYAEFIAGAGTGRALDVAGGAGRHSLWLAERDWKVTLVDISETGIDLARKNIANHSYQDRVRAEVMDLQANRLLGDEQYDLIIVFLYLQRSLFPALISALKPGGFMVYKTFMLEQCELGGGPTNPMYLLKSDELLQAFASLQILFYQERVEDRAVAELVARKNG